MSRGGHNWRGGGTVEGSRSLDVMKLARAGYLSGVRFGSWQWTYGDGTKASIQIAGTRDAVTLDYRIRSGGEDWQSVHQRVPIRWTLCRFGGERPWFVCDMPMAGMVGDGCALYGAGGPPGSLHRIHDQRDGPMDRPIITCDACIACCADMTGQTECRPGAEVDAATNVSSRRAAVGAGEAAWMSSSWPRAADTRQGRQIETTWRDATMNTLPSPDAGA
jgi:hypothetical protein